MNTGPQEARKQNLKYIWCTHCSFLSAKVPEIDLNPHSTPKNWHTNIWITPRRATKFCYEFWDMAKRLTDCKRRSLEEQMMHPLLKSYGQIGQKTTPTPPKPHANSLTTQPPVTIFWHVFWDMTRRPPKHHETNFYLYMMLPYSILTAKICTNWPNYHPSPPKPDLNSLTS